MRPTTPRPLLFPWAPSCACDTRDSAPAAALGGEMRWAKGEAVALQIAERGGDQHLGRGDAPRPDHLRDAAQAHAAALQHHIRRGRPVDVDHFLNRMIVQA